MKIGIKKIHENEWSVHIGNASIRMDQFSVALLNITLEHLLALEHGDEHSILDSYISLGLRLKQLRPSDLQKLIQTIDNRDLLNLMLVAKDDDLNAIVMKNMGGILLKQFEVDMANTEEPNHDDARESIKTIIETMFKLEGDGQLEVINEKTRYI